MLLSFLFFSFPLNLNYLLLSLLLHFLFPFSSIYCRHFAFLSSILHPFFRYEYYLSYSSTLFLCHLFLISSIILSFTCSFFPSLFIYIPCFLAFSPILFFSLSVSLPPSAAFLPVLITLVFLISFLLLPFSSSFRPFYLSLLWYSSFVQFVIFPFSHQCPFVFCLHLLSVPFL